MSRRESKYADLAMAGPGGLKQELSLPELSSFGISSSAPLTVVAGAAAGMFALGVPGTPLMFLAVSAVAALWAVGYVALSRRVQSAGAQAAFISRGLGRTAGVAAQGVALVAYSGIYVCLYGLFGVVAGSVVTRWTGYEAPWWLWSLVCAVGVGLLGRTRVKIAGWVLTVLLALEVAAVLLVIVAGFTRPFGGQVDLADLNPATLLSYGWVGVGGLLAYTVASMSGVEETPGLAEDARNGRRNVGRAVMIAIGTCAVLYASATLAESVGEGPGNVAGVAADPTSDFPFDLIAGGFGSAGTALAEAVRVLLATSIFAALASFHTIVVRYLFAAGRDRVVAARLGRINPRNSSPSNASYAVSAVGLVVIGAFAVLGGEPFSGLFAWGAYIGAVGILALMIGSSLAVVGYFAKHRDQRPSVVVCVVAPVAAAVMMLGLWLVMLTNSETMIGAARFGGLHLALVAFLVAGLVLGLIRARTLRRREPEVWARLAGPTPAETEPGLASVGNGPAYAGKAYRL